MFTYTADFSSLTHYIIKNFVKEKSVAIDGTLGNGFDTDFLADNFKLVYAFDIQKIACETYKQKEKQNVLVINDSHHKFLEYIKENVNCIVYNLGFLPGGDKSITTCYNSSLESIKLGLDILESEGMMLITSYRGHDEGMSEYIYIKEHLDNLPKNRYAVMKHEIINRSNKSPVLFVIEKK